MALLMARYLVDLTVLLMVQMWEPQWENELALLLARYLVNLTVLLMGQQWEIS